MFAWALLVPGKGKIALSIVSLILPDMAFGLPQVIAGFLLMVASW